MTDVLDPDVLVMVDGDLSGVVYLEPADHGWELRGSNLPAEDGALLDAASAGSWTPNP